MTTPDTNWHIFRAEPLLKEDREKRLAEMLKQPPAWRKFDGKLPEKPPELLRDSESGASRRISQRYRGKKYQAGPREIEMVNTALYLRRPLLVMGDPGTGKSSLAYAVADQLELGEVLYWPVTTRSTLREALYDYDAIGRLQETDLSRWKNFCPDKGGAAGTEPVETVKPAGECGCEAPIIGRFITLGPLGTALLPSKRPRVLLIDEIDKSDIDLPNDLLNVFEEGGFNIPELKRLSETQPDVEVFTCDDRKTTIHKGEVLCRAFPFVVLTSNRERELPAPFLRRCLRLDIPRPDEKKLEKIVHAHFGEEDNALLEKAEALIKAYLEKEQDRQLLSADQLLNAVYLAARGVDMTRKELVDAIMRDLNNQG